jgi:hypothetical protein
MKCPTCKKEYNNIEKHGRKRHPYEVENTTEWKKLLSSIKSGEKRAQKEIEKEEAKATGPSLREKRDTVYDIAMPYRGVVSITIMAKTHGTARDTILDLMDQFRTNVPPSVAKVDLVEVLEQF